MEAEGTTIDKALEGFGKLSFGVLLVGYAVIVVPVFAAVMSAAVGADAISEKFKSIKSDNSKKNAL